MDGNRRWAKEKLLPSKQGHKKGAEKLIKISEYLYEYDIKYATFYAFSTENWSRSKEEVETLLNLIREYLKKDIKKIQNDSRFNLNIIGNIENLPIDIKDELSKIKKDFSKNKDKLTITIAINYGSLDEIKRACNYVIQNKLSGDDILNHLDTKDLPNPDIIVRSGGESRLSNFLLLQSAYSEIYFSKTLWPDFSKKDLNIILDWFSKIKRNYGN